MIGSILELPFAEREVFDLLGFDGARATVDLDYAGYGWCRLPRVWLDAGGVVTAVEAPVVLALHAADDGAAVAGDVELEFAVDGGAVAVPLSAFLDRWLPRLPPGPVVLAMCNPYDARLPARARPLHHALGAVDAWHDLDGDRVRLAARTWLSLPETP